MALVQDQRYPELLQLINDSPLGAVNLAAISRPVDKPPDSIILHMLAFRPAGRTAPADVREAYDECCKIITARFKHSEFMDIRDNRDCTALHVACAQGNVRMIKECLMGGASVYEELCVRDRYVHATMCCIYCRPLCVFTSVLQLFVSIICY